MKLKTTIKKLINQIRKSVLGEEVINFRNQGVINLIDVGSVGDLPFPWKNNANQIQHLLKFEPRDTPSQNPYIKSIDTALWDTNTEREFYIYKGLSGSGSSLFKQNYDYVSENFENLKHQGPKELANTWFERSKLDRVEKIQCRKLDDIIQELDEPFSYHFLKIDAQGAEYEILRGAENLLSSSCLGLHLELFTIPMYKGIKLLPEVEVYLKNFGFELVKKFPAHGSFNSQHDCLFLKTQNDSHLLKIIKKIYQV